MPPVRPRGALPVFDGGTALLAAALIWPSGAPVWAVAVLSGALLGMLRLCGAYRDDPCRLPARALGAGLIVFTLGAWVRPEIVSPLAWLVTGISATGGAGGMRYWLWRRRSRELARTWWIDAPPEARQRLIRELAERCPAARVTDDPDRACGRIVGQPAAPAGALTATGVFERFWFKLPLARRGETWPAPPALPPAAKGVGYAERLFGLLGLVAASPALLIAAAAVFVVSPGPVLHRQTRVGLGGRHFVMLKLRTMRPGAEESGVLWSPPADPRILSGLRWLRAMHLDELPQLWNLVRGEMALVGPRPERPEFIPELVREIPSYDLRHRIPPGITGWAQVMHSYGGSVEDARRKCEYDLYYLKHRSPALDALILFETALAVLRARGR